MNAKPSIKRALLSASNKGGLVEFATKLHELGIEIIATGGTAELLSTSNIPVIAIQDVTGFPEIMDGRVKTLHPNIHGGILARRGIDDAILETHKITPIDLVVVNLYPFQKTIKRPECTLQEAIENIDIGGPTLLRAAAKNQEFVTVIVDPIDYQRVLKEIETQGNTTDTTRQYLAKKAFMHTAEYDIAIANYLNAPHTFMLPLCKKTELRYGENPHQRSGLYIKAIEHNSLTQAKQLQGIPLSFNNLMDSNTALRCVRALDTSSPACAIVKHATPCGVAQADSLKDAYLNALATDPASAYGGIIAINRNLDATTAQTIIDNQFAEVILAPSFNKDALTTLSTKKVLRLLATGYDTPHDATATFHCISGGLLMQETDETPDDPATFTVVSQRQPSPHEMADCLFAWRVVRYVKSNAIVYAKNGQTLGIGTGQTSRVFSAKIAVQKAEEAGLSLQGAAVASDAFYPFADGIEVAAAAGITAVIQPGGSKRDAEVIEAANRLNIAMVFTHVRHFRH